MLRCCAVVPAFIFAVDSAWPCFGAKCRGTLSCYLQLYISAGLRLAFIIHLFLFPGAEPFGRLSLLNRFEGPHFVAMDASTLRVGRLRLAVTYMLSPHGQALTVSPRTFQSSHVGHPTVIPGSNDIHCAAPLSRLPYVGGTLSGTFDVVYSH